MDEYPLIANHGLVGDLQTAALVSSEGTVDWWCSPRFDSPSLFAALLDRHRGGHCRLAVASDVRGQATVRQLYLPDTAILFTRFMAPSGVGEVADYMLPDESGTPTDRHRRHSSATSAAAIRSSSVAPSLAQVSSRNAAPPRSPKNAHTSAGGGAPAADQSA